MFGLTRNQILGCAIVVVSVLGGATTQLNDLFGPTVAKSTVAACVILTGIFGGWVAAVGGVGTMVRDVAALPGVDRVTVNTNALPAVAAAAVDAAQPKVAPTNPGDRARLQQLAS
jgi:hypothetical protein